MRSFSQLSTQSFLRVNAVSFPAVNLMEYIQSTESTVDLMVNNAAVFSRSDRALLNIARAFIYNPEVLVVCNTCKAVHELTAHCVFPGSSRRQSGGFFPVSSLLSVEKKPYIHVVRLQTTFFRIFAASKWLGSL